MDPEAAALLGGDDGKGLGGPGGGPHFALGGRFRLLIDPNAEQRRPGVGWLSRTTSAVKDGIFALLYTLNKNDTSGSNSLTVLLTAINFIQTLGFPLSPILWSDTPLSYLTPAFALLSLRDIAGSIVGLHRSDVQFATFAIASLWVLGVCGTAIWVAVTYAQRGTPPVLWPQRLLRLTAVLTATVAFIPLVNALLSISDCASVGSVPLSGQLQCGSGVYAGLLSLALIEVAALCSLSLLVAATFYTRDPSSPAINSKIHSRVEVVRLLSVLVLTITVAFQASFARQGGDGIRFFLAILIIGTAVRIVPLFLMPPFHRQLWNRTQAALEGAHAWAVLSTLLKVAVLDEGDHKVAATIVLLAGLVPAAAAGASLMDARVAAIEAAPVQEVRLFVPMLVELKARRLHERLSMSRSRSRGGASGAAGGDGVGMGWISHAFAAVGFGGAGAGGGGGFGGGHLDAARGYHGGVFSAVEALYVSAIQLHPSSALLHVFAAGYFQHYGSGIHRRKELALLAAAERMEPAPDTLFLLRERRKQLEDASNGIQPSPDGPGGVSDLATTLSEAGPMSVMSRLAFDKHLADAIMHSLRARAAIVALWSALNIDLPDLDKLHQACVAFVDRMRLAETAFESAVAVNPRDVFVLRSYASFLNDTGDESRARELRGQAERLEGAQQRTSHARPAALLLLAPSSTGALDAPDSATGVLGLTIDTNARLPLITSASPSMSRLLGFAPGELAGKPLPALFSRPTNALFFHLLRDWTDSIIGGRPMMISSGPGGVNSTGNALSTTTANALASASSRLTRAPVTALLSTRSGYCVPVMWQLYGGADQLVAVVQPASMRDEGSIAFVAVLRDAADEMVDDGYDEGGGADNGTMMMTGTQSLVQQQQQQQQQYHLAAPSISYDTGTPMVPRRSSIQPAVARRSSTHKQPGLAMSSSLSSSQSGVMAGDRDRATHVAGPPRPPLSHRKNMANTGSSGSLRTSITARGIVGGGVSGGNGTDGQRSAGSSVYDASSYTNERDGNGDDGSMDENDAISSMLGLDSVEDAQLVTDDNSALPPSVAGRFNGDNTQSRNGGGGNVRPGMIRVASFSSTGKGNGGDAQSKASGSQRRIRYQDQLELAVADAENDAGDAGDDDGADPYERSRQQFQQQQRLEEATMLAADADDDEDDNGMAQGPSAPVPILKCYLTAACASSSALLRIPHSEIARSARVAMDPSTAQDPKVTIAAESLRAAGLSSPRFGNNGGSNNATQPIDISSIIGALPDAVVAACAEALLATEEASRQQRYDPVTASRAGMDGGYGAGFGINGSGGGAWDGSVGDGGGGAGGMGGSPPFGSGGGGGAGGGGGIGSGRNGNASPYGGEGFAGLFASFENGYSSPFGHGGAAAGVGGGGMGAGAAFGRGGAQSQVAKRLLPLTRGVWGSTHTLSAPIMAQVPGLRGHNVTIECRLQCVQVPQAARGTDPETERVLSAVATSAAMGGDQSLLPGALPVLAAATSSETFYVLHWRRRKDKEVEREKSKSKSYPTSGSAVNSGSVISSQPQPQPAPLPATGPALVTQQPQPAPSGASALPTLSDNTSFIAELSPAAAASSTEQVGNSLASPPLTIALPSASKQRVRTDITNYGSSREAINFNNEGSSTPLVTSTLARRASGRGWANNNGSNGGPGTLPRRPSLAAMTTTQQQSGNRMQTSAKVVPWSPPAQQYQQQQTGPLNNGPPQWIGRSGGGGDAVSEAPSGSRGNRSDRSSVAAKKRLAMLRRALHTDALGSDTALKRLKTAYGVLFFSVMVVLAAMHFLLTHDISAVSDSALAMANVGRLRVLVETLHADLLALALAAGGYTYIPQAATGSSASSASSSSTSTTLAASTPIGILRSSWPSLLSAAWEVSYNGDYAGAVSLLESADVISASDAYSSYSAAASSTSGAASQNATGTGSLLLPSEPVHPASYALQHGLLTLRAFEALSLFVLDNCRGPLGPADYLLRFQDQTVVQLTELVAVPSSSTSSTTPTCPAGSAAINTSSASGGILAPLRPVVVPASLTTSLLRTIQAASSVLDRAQSVEMQYWAFINGTATVGGHQQQPGYLSVPLLGVPASDPVLAWLLINAPVLDAALEATAEALQVVAGNAYSLAAWLPACMIITCVLLLDVLLLALILPTLAAFEDDKDRVLRAFLHVPGSVVTELHARSESQLARETRTAQGADPEDDSDDDDNDDDMSELASPLARNRRSISQPPNGGAGGGGSGVSGAGKSSTTGPVVSFKDVVAMAMMNKAGLNKGSSSAASPHGQPSGADQPLSVSMQQGSAPGSLTSLPFSGSSKGLLGQSTRRSSLAALMSPTGAAASMTIGGGQRPSATNSNSISINVAGKAASRVPGGGSQSPRRSSALTPNGSSAGAGGGWAAIRNAVNSNRRQSFTDNLSGQMAHPSVAAIRVSPAAGAAASSSAGGGRASFPALSSASMEQVDSTNTASPRVVAGGVIDAAAGASTFGDAGGYGSESDLSRAHYPTGHSPASSLVSPSHAMQLAQSHAMMQQQHVIIQQQQQLQMAQMHQRMANSPPDSEYQGRRGPSSVLSAGNSIFSLAAPRRFTKSSRQYLALVLRFAAPVVAAFMFLAALYGYSQIIVLSMRLTPVWLRDATNRHIALLRTATAMKYHAVGSDPYSLVAQAITSSGRNGLQSSTSVTAIAGCSGPSLSTSQAAVDLSAALEAAPHASYAALLASPVASVSSSAAATYIDSNSAYVRIYSSHYGDLSYWSRMLLQTHSALAFGVANYGLLGADDEIVTLADPESAFSMDLIGSHSIRQALVPNGLPGETVITASDIATYIGTGSGQDIGSASLSGNSAGASSATSSSGGSAGSSTYASGASATSALKRTQELQRVRAHQVLYFENGCDSDLALLDSAYVSSQITDLSSADSTTTGSASVVTSTLLPVLTSSSASTSVTTSTTANTVSSTYRYNPASFCSQFDGGLLSRGLHVAILDFAFQASQLAARMPANASAPYYASATSSSSSSAACTLAFTTTGSGSSAVTTASTIANAALASAVPAGSSAALSAACSLLHSSDYAMADSLARSHLPRALRYAAALHESLLDTLADSYTLVNGSMLAGLASAMFVFFITIYNPAIEKVGREVAATSRVLLLLPQDTMALAPVQAVLESIMRQLQRRAVQRV